MTADAPLHYQVFVAPLAVYYGSLGLRYDNSAFSITAHVFSPSPGNDLLTEAYGSWYLPFGFLGGRLFLTAGAIESFALPGTVRAFSWPTACLGVGYKVAWRDLEFELCPAVLASSTLGVTTSLLGGPPLLTLRWNVSSHLDVALQSSLSIPLGLEFNF